MYTTEEKASLAKEKIQTIVYNKFLELPREYRYGAAYLATGTGKSRIAIMLAMTLLKSNPNCRILIVVPTQRLRDSNWKDETLKWGSEELWSHMERACYASIKNIQSNIFDFVILDEGHNLTENNSEFFNNNVVKACLLLTGTKPTKGVKKDIIQDLMFKTLLVITLDKAEKLGLVAPYKITVITMLLDDKLKYILTGREGNKFLVTEKQYYNNLSFRIFKTPSKFHFINRMNLIKSLKSKTEVAKLILQNVIPASKKTLIFCGSIEQAIELCPRRFYSKPNISKKDKDDPIKLKKYQHYLHNYEGDAALEDLNKGIINRASCVDALNEGHNIENLDIGYINQVNSSEKDLKQRIGRIVRFRVGHTANIVILCVKDTVDEDWVRKCLASIDKEKIRWVELGKLRTGEEKILFD